MNYYIVTTTYSTYKQFLRPYSNRLIDNGYDVILLCNINGINSIEDQKVKVLNIPFERQLFRLGNFKALFEVRSIFKNVHGIINVHTPIAAAITRIALLGLPSKIIYTSHGFHFHRNSNFLSWLFYFPIELVLSKVTDRIITINKQDYLLSKRLFSKTKTYYINGIGYDNKYNVNKHQSLKSELGIPEDAKIILSVGELNHNKNHKLILEYFKYRKIRSNLHYIICGKGPLEEKLRDYCSNNKIANQVHFLGYRNDVQLIMRESNVFGFPSLREGLPVSLMEAISIGMDVIAFNIRGNEDLIPEEHQKNFLVRPYSRMDFFSLLDTKLDNFDSDTQFKTSASWIMNNQLSNVIDLYIEMITNIK